MRAPFGLRIELIAALADRKTRARCFWRDCRGISARHAGNVSSDSAREILRLLIQGRHGRFHGCLRPEQKASSFRKDHVAASCLTIGTIRIAVPVAPSSENVTLLLEPMVEIE
jgi:hypothetical protein